MLLSFFKDLFCSRIREPSSFWESDSSEQSDEHLSADTQPNAKYLALDLDQTIVYCRRLSVEAPATAGEV